MSAFVSLTLTPVMCAQFLKRHSGHKRGWLDQKCEDVFEACLRFYETKRPVRTASVAQVRQPIFTTSVERWRRYEKHLGPLFEALGPYAPAHRRSSVSPE